MHQQLQLQHQPYSRASSSLQPAKLCKRILCCDLRIVSVSYMKDDGICAEATRLSIASYDTLTVMRLPLKGRDSLVLAVLLHSDLPDLVGRVKRQI